MNLTGIYRAVVVSVENFSAPPHRIRVAIPSLTDAQGVWALPCWPTPAGDPRTPPAVGEGVWVMFEGADPHYPVYVGFFGEGTGS